MNKTVSQLIREQLNISEKKLSDYTEISHKESTESINDNEDAIIEASEDISDNEISILELSEMLSDLIAEVEELKRKVGE